MAYKNLFEKIRFLNLLKQLKNFVMSNSFNHQSFLKAGAEKEQEFANLLVLRNGGVISHSDRSTDIKDHIDLF